MVVVTIYKWCNNLGGMEIELIKALEENPEMAVKIIYKNYYNSLFVVAQSIVRDVATAKDVMQDSIIKIWLKARSYKKRIAKPFTWMRNIVKNTAIRCFEKKLKYFQSTDDLDVFMMLKNMTQQPFNIDLIDFEYHFNTLKVKNKLPIQLNYMQGFTQEEISQKLGWKL